MSRPRRALLALLSAGLLTGAVVAGALVLGIGADDETPADARPTSDVPTTVAATPLADYDSRTVAVAREAFCDAVPPEAVARALGDAAARRTAYVDGERARLTGSVRDIAHEFACRWSRGQGTDAVVARAWVFAPPVTTQQSRELARSAADADGCGLLRPRAAFGSVSVGLRCALAPTEAEPGAVELSRRGLFGDAWLACSLAGPAAVLDGELGTERLDEWCVAVAQAASGTVPVVG